MKEEVWKDIPSYEGRYQISNFGEVKSLGQKKKGAYLNKVLHNPKGNYFVYQVHLYKDWVRKHFMVHRLVAEAFIPNLENKLQVNHIDGNPKNNHVSNLEWCTNQENCIHSYKTGLRRQKLSEEKVRDIYISTKKYKELSQQYEVSYKTIYLIKKNKSWKWLEK